MAVCKGILDDVRIIAVALDFGIGDGIVEYIATQNEMFLQEILCDASSICTSSKRKIISRDDVQKAAETRSLPFFCVPLGEPAQ